MMIRNVKEATRRKVWKSHPEDQLSNPTCVLPLAVGRTQVLGLVIPMAVSSVFIDPYFPLLIQGDLFGLQPAGLFHDAVAGPSRISNSAWPARS